MDQGKTIVIIGAGVAGLVAAYELEKRGFSPLIFEAESRAGGRVQTDKINGFLLDHGFQVLLTSYPEARRYLDYDKLDLRYFAAGAKIVDRQNKYYTLMNPIRHPEKIIGSLFSGAATLGDKIKLALLAQRLLKKESVKIFEDEETATIDYLEKKGFSAKIIENFFRPFFGGIFLESELMTSSRMFEFVLKMFGEGSAAIPALGMQKIPEQLLGNLKKSKIQFNKKVERIDNLTIYFDDGSSLECDSVIIATDPSRIIPGLMHHPQDYHSVDNLYFETERSVFKENVISLFSGKESLVNNICFLSDISEYYAPDGRNLLSVSIVKDHGLENEKLINQVVNELQQRLPGVGKISFIKYYNIKNALPILSDLQYQIDPQNLKIYEHVFIAGDQTLNPSLNAAMLSGRLAAEAIHF